MSYKNPADKIHWQQQDRAAHPDRQKAYWAQSRKVQQGEPGSETRRIYNEKDRVRRKRRRGEKILAELATARRLEEERTRRERERGYTGEINMDAVREGAGDDGEIYKQQPRQHQAE